MVWPGVPPAPDEPETLPELVPPPEVVLPPEPEPPREPLPPLCLCDPWLANGSVYPLSLLCAYAAGARSAMNTVRAVTIRSIR